MPQFDLRHIQVANYAASGSTITYTNKLSVGDAMAVNLALRFAEGRLYAEGALSEMLRMAIGGTISIGVKYIPDAAKKQMYGSAEKSRTVGSKTVKSLVTGKNDSPAYQGVSCYAPDMVDKVKKYTCFFVHCATFGQPDTQLQTLGESITFQTPTTTGEFLPDAAGDLIESVTVDTEAEAIAWCDAVLGGASA